MWSLYSKGFFLKFSYADPMVMIGHNRIKCDNSPSLKYDLVKALSKFEKNWKGGEPGITEKLKESLRPETQVRKKVQGVIRAMETQNRKMNTSITNLQNKDKGYYSKMLDALRNYDRERATFYANEIAEVRKALKSMKHARLALEQISLRMSTVKDIGDLVATLGPALSVLQSIKGTLSNVLPSADEEFGAITDLMSGLVADVGQMGGITMNFTASSDEAENILKDAERQVEIEMKERLPSVPLEEEKGEIHL